MGVVNFLLWLFLHRHKAVGTHWIGNSMGPRRHNGKYNLKKDFTRQQNLFLKNRTEADDFN
jgi:hypothetical protein